MKWAKGSLRWFGTILILSAHALAQDSLLSIVSPADHSVVFEGQTITIKVTADHSVQNLAIMGQYPLPQAQPTGNPGEFSMKMPTNIDPGLYQFGAVGSAPGQPAFSRPIQIQLERKDLPIGIRTAQPISVLTAGQPDDGVELYGEYSDGTKLCLSKSTQIWGSSNDPTVAIIDDQRAPGDSIRLKGLRPGKTVIVFNIGKGASAQSTAMFVEVREPPPSGPPR